MFNKIFQVSKRGLLGIRSALIFIGAAALAIALIIFTSDSGNPASGTYDAKKAHAYMEALNVQTEQPQGEARIIGGRTWFKMAEQSGAALWLEPLLGQIALENQATGAFWLSNPGKEELAKAEGKGIWATNLEAPILFRYLDEGQSNEKVTNTVEQKAKVEWVALERGVGVLYTLDALGFTFYVKYAIEDGELIVSMPEEGIWENGGKRLVSMDLLPFFGASLDGPDGYLFVPDGPGALIRFNQEDNDQLMPYSFPVYGYDPAVSTVSAYENRTDIAFPIFGLNRGTDSFIAIIEQGAPKTAILAAPAGVNTMFNEVHTRIMLRNYYYQPIGLSDDHFKNTYESSLAPSKIKLRYLITEKGKSDYVGMAQQYRSYLMKHQNVQALKARKGADFGQGVPPLMLNFVMSAAERGPIGESLVVGTTFKEAADIVDNLVQDGITKLDVSLTGWNSGGFPGRLPDRFPIEGKIGGESGFRDFKAALDTLHIPISINDAPFYATDKSSNGFSVRDDAIKNINGTIVSWSQQGDWYDDAQARNFYFMNPLQAKKKWGATLAELKQLGIGGVHVQTYSHGFSDFRKENRVNRETSISALQAMLDEASSELGSVQASAAAYSLGHADYLSGMPLDSNYDLIVDEQVPFFPIAIHGLATYSGNAGNVRRDPVNEFLRDIEYGALPTYMVMESDPRVMKRTNFASLFSAQFDTLREKMVEEYGAYQASGTDVWASFIEGHRKVSEGVYETSYEGGRKVWVNYNNQPFEAEGVSIGASTFKVIQEGSE
ncbi:DUF5696 domain-containing protein [Paenibacillus paridis]|uniref:DUF5696 domain-containing protein n=1 Tax=Paenibacillus paridis TaxID=2583376 RepID=UPI0011249D7A|nr:DUF5696 domain-containing protein [Paenibacillus paridis]